jgi:hypothetical protein
VDLLLTATAPAAALGSMITLTAAATSQADEPDTGNNHDSDAITVVASADLSVTLAGPILAHRGGVFAYTATALNAGPSVASQPVVVLAADVPWNSAVAQAPSGWQCVRLSSGNFHATCTADAGTLASQAPAFGVVVSPVGAAYPRRFTVSAGISSADHDPDTTNNAAAVRSILTR